jgi:predicted DNA-binding transcriptional regulator AlpA
MSQEKVDGFISGPKLCKRHDVSKQTIWRRINDRALNFPQPIRINGRNFFKIAEIEEFERRMAGTANTFKPIGEAAGRVVDKLSKRRS